LQSNYTQNPYLTKFKIHQILQIELLDEYDVSKGSSKGNLSSDIKALFNDRNFTDVTIKIGENTLEVHKLILIGN
jgi:outer membrane protein assembly factor BamA